MTDKTDKLILFELLQDCRQPASKIAKRLRIPQQTVTYRIKKLEKDKIIKKYTVNLDYSKLGFHRHSLYLDLKTVSAKEVDVYLAKITDIKEVSCCYMLHDISEWKIYISVWTKTIERYDEIQTKIITKFKKYLVNYLSFQSVKSYTYFAGRLNPNAKAKVDIKSEEDNINLKETDWKIIQKLKSNSTISYLDLSRSIKTSINTVIRRIKFMQSKGIIQRFYPILDMNKIGYTEYTFISRIDPSKSKDVDKFIEYIKKDPRFIIVIKAVGYVNLYYAFLVEDSKELKEIMGNIDKIIGKATLEKHKIEVETMVS